MQHVRTGRGSDPVAALEVAAVSHSYGQKRALNDVSFAITPGTFTVLLGLNGAGKTTLFSLISHLYDTRQGSVRIFGHDIGRAPGEALRRLGIVFQARTSTSISASTRIPPTMPRCTGWVRPKRGSASTLSWRRST